MTAWTQGEFCRRSAVFAILAVTMGLHAQSTSTPAKAGLWETTVSSTRAMQMPPELAAKIAAMPPAQQAMMQSQMQGMGGGKPIVATRQSCSTGQDSMDSLLSRAQSSAMKCTFPNRVQTADGASFDISCTGDQGTAKGHMEFHMPDTEHVNGTAHITITGTAQGRTMNTTVDNTTTAKWLGADCGDVKPSTSAVAN